MSNAIIGLFPTADRLLEASATEIQRMLLRQIVAVGGDPMRRMTTCGSEVTALFVLGGYACDLHKRNTVERTINRAWKALEDAGLIEAPDLDNGKNGFRVASEAGRAIDNEVDFEAAKVRSGFTRAMFHLSLPNASWNAFRAGDYDTAVFEAFKAVEVTVRKKAVGKNSIVETDFGVDLMKKAFDRDAGPLSDMKARPSRRDRRCELFTGAFGELRNPKAHQDPTIDDPLIAVEEMMTASALLRIVDNA